MSHTQSNPFAGGLLQPKHSFASCCPPTLVFGKKQGCFYLFLSAPEEQALRVHKIVIYMIKVTPAKVSEKAKFSHRPQRSKSSPTTLLPSFVVCEVQVLNPEQDFVGYKTNIWLSYVYIRERSASYIYGSLIHCQETASLGSTEESIPLPSHTFLCLSLLHSIYREQPRQKEILNNCLVHRHLLYMAI